MPLKVCLSTPNTLMYPQGGHLWVFINWALGLKSCGCDVTWLDVAPPSISLDESSARLEVLRASLRPFALDTNLVVDFLGEDSSHQLREASLPTLESLGPFDLLVDFRYNLPERLFLNFRRKILINIDPGTYEQALAGDVYPHPIQRQWLTCRHESRRHARLAPRGGSTHRRSPQYDLIRGGQCL